MGTLQKRYQNVEVIKCHGYESSSHQYLLSTFTCILPFHPHRNLSDEEAKTQRDYLTFSRSCGLWWSQANESGIRVLVFLAPGSAIPHHTLLPPSGNPLQRTGTTTWERKELDRNTCYSRHAWRFTKRKNSCNAAGQKWRHWRRKGNNIFIVWPDIYF